MQLTLPRGGASLTALTHELRVALLARGLDHATFRVGAHPNGNGYSVVVEGADARVLEQVVRDAASAAGAVKQARATTGV